MSVIKSKYKLDVVEVDESAPRAHNLSQSDANKNLKILNFVFEMTELELVLPLLSKKISIH